MSNKFEEKARNLILNQLYHINVEELSKQLHLGPSQVYRKIKKATGYSTAIFIRNIRLEKAIYLLTKTDIPIKRIGYQVGFNEVSYFYRCFKAVYGITPKNYRANYSQTFSFV